MSDFQSVAVNDLIYRVSNLEKALASLKASLVAEKGTPPFDRGGLLYPPGDAIPSRSSFDNFLGKVWLFKETPLRLAKNLTKRVLEPGEEYEPGKFVSKDTNFPVEPNNIFWADA